MHSLLTIRLYEPSNQLSSWDPRQTSTSLHLQGQTRAPTTYTYKARMIDQRSILSLSAPHIIDSLSFFGSEISLYRPSQGDHNVNATSPMLVNASEN